MPSMPDGFEGVMLSGPQIWAAQFLGLMAGPLKGAVKPLGVFVYCVVPFYYAFGGASTRLFRFLVYPLLYALPWVVYVMEKSAFTVWLLDAFMPFAGYVYFILLANQLSWKKQKPARSLVKIVAFSLLAVCTALAPIQGLSAETGIWMQLSWPVAAPKIAFGVMAFNEMSQARSPDFQQISSVVAVPFMAHAWMCCAAAVVVNAFKLLFRREKKQRRQETEEELVYE